MRARMQRQRSKDTGAEVAVRRALHAAGLRYRVHRQPLPSLRRTADVVFPRARVAVFVDGCFWHGCPEHGRRQHRVNDWYWPAKIERNRRRDRDTDARLGEAGWSVVRIWEHEAPDVAVARVRAALDAARR
jgi:DNA mismatch endonuclease (patch repair protein)